MVQLSISFSHVNYYGDGASQEQSAHWKRHFYKPLLQPFNRPEFNGKDRDRSGCAKGKDVITLFVISL